MTRRSPRVSLAALRMAALRLLHPVQWRAEVRAALRAAGTIRGAARALGVSAHMVAPWLDSDDDLAAGYERRGPGRPVRR